ncbi:MAG TPA: DUF3106 domain-containing protein [Gammaproteobacteria bacterium]|nr:DUF3106 domain-containing protein [Gammaproteobacteria bacterium]
MKTTRITLKKGFIFLGAAAFCYAQSIHAQTTDTSTTTNAPAAQTAPMAGGMQTATPEQMQEMQKKWQNMTPAEKEQMRAKAKEAWEKMTPEQKEQLREQMRQRMQNMTPEQRKQMMERMHKEWEALSPEKKQELVNKAQERWNKLTPEQQTRLMEHVQMMEGQSAQ